jgi:hypothetical protein
MDGLIRISTGRTTVPKFLVLEYDMRLNRILWIHLLLTAVIATAPFCKKETAPPPEIVKKYQADADRFCGAIVECMKEDVRTRMKDRPERRDMVLKRMDRDLCIKGQYALIGRLSVDPYPEPARTDPESYATYSECADAVAAAPDCDIRRERYNTHPACVKIRGIIPR